jgi:hypothetical protein
MGEGESSSVGRRIQQFWKLQETGLAVPSPVGYLFTVAAGVPPAVEPGILPGGMGVWFEKSLPFRTSGPGGKMPPSTAAKMAAATDVNHTLNTYPVGRERVRVRVVLFEKRDAPDLRQATGL